MEIIDKQHFRDKFNYKVLKLRKDKGNINLLLDKEFENIDELKDTINKVNISFVFSIFTKFSEEFMTNLVENNKIIYITSKTEEEIKKKIEEEKIKYGEVNIISIKFYQNFGYFIGEIIIKGERVIAKVEEYNYKYVLKLENGKVLDFIEIVKMLIKSKELLNPNYNNAIREIIKVFKIKIKDISEIEERYDDNINRIKELEINNNSNFTKYLLTNRANYLTDYLKIIEYCREKSFEHSVDNNKSRKVISVSSRFLADILNKKHNTIVPIINIFCVLGLLEKVRKENTDISSGNTLYNEINIFYVHKIDDILKIANERAEVLLTNNISVSKFTEKVCIDLFGEEVAKTVYLQK